MIAIRYLSPITGKDTRVQYLLPVAIFGPEKCTRRKKCDSQVTHKFIETEIDKCLLSRSYANSLLRHL